VAEAPKSFADALARATALWTGISFRNRALLIGSAALVGITLWLFVGLMGKPKYVILYSGLKSGEAQALAGRLAAKNIAYQLSPDGSSLLVPEEQLDPARLETASQGLPRNARLGFELFDSPNWAGSDFTEKVNYQRALEGELERTLQTLSEVEAVRVHLVLSHESLYTEQESPAKAAVILKTHGNHLSEQAQLAIPQLVASAVEGLRPENVTVVDADTNTPMLHPSGLGDGRVAYELDDGLSKTLVRTLEPVVGEGHVRASVHVEYDLSTTENTDEVYDPKTSATLTQQKSDENMGGGGPAGIPGTASNLPGGAGTTVNVPAENQSSHSESATFAVSKSTRHTTFPAGRIKRIAAAVLIDDAMDLTNQGGKQGLTRRKRTADEMKQIQQLSSAAIGLDGQRGDVLTLENLSFQQLPIEVPSAPSRIDMWRHRLEQWLNVLRYAGILTLFLIVYFLVLRPVKKQVLTAFRELPGKLANQQRATTATLEPQPEIVLPEASPDSRRATTLKQQLSEKVKGEPAAASRLVQGWIREESK
jgi:flagellar M-ring protein FliF